MFQRRAHESKAVLPGAGDRSVDLLFKRYRTLDAAIDQLGTIIGGFMSRRIAFGVYVITRHPDFAIKHLKIHRFVR